MEKVEFLQIEPTTRCNFTCGFCCGRHMPQADLDFERFEQALSSLPDLRHIELQGEGEPLLHPRIFDMMDLARRRGILVSSITNGSYFTPGNVERLLEQQVQKLRISIESPEPSMFRSIRGGKLEKVLEGIARLIQTRNERGLERPAVGFAVMVMRQTLPQLDGILDLYERLGMDGGVSVQPLQRMEGYAQFYDAEILEQQLQPREAMRMWRWFQSSERLQSIQKRQNPNQHFSEELFEGWTPQSRSCPWLERGLFVNYAGGSSGCCAMKEERFQFGQLGESGLAEILERREPLRRQLREGQTPEACHGCALARMIVANAPRPTSGARTAP